MPTRGIRHRVGDGEVEWDLNLLGTIKFFTLLAFLYENLGLAGIVGCK